jgi:lysozyme
MIPKSKPAQDAKVTERIIRAVGVKDAVAMLGVRGYYRDSMGKVGVNDRGIYDDAIFLLSPNGHFAFNANTDPSVARDGIATLNTGIWRYKLGIHGLSKPKHLQYRALVQAAPVTVSRDNRPSQTGWFGINIHRGSNNSTSSLGCQTIPPAQWTAFIALVEQEMKRAGQREISYFLTSV